MEIKKNLTMKNYNAGNAARIMYIVVHYTGNNGDTALANTNYFKSDRGASAHYFVDENSVYQSVEDKNIAWHCGASRYFHPECRNHNSIGVEMCSFIGADGKYNFKTKTVENTVWLVKMLMEKYNVPVKNVVRHYDVTKKICPEPYVRDGNAWAAFKNRLAKEDIAEDKEMVEKITVNINGKDYKADRILKDGRNFICIADMKQAGFDVGYNEKTKVPSISNRLKELPLNVDGRDTSIETVNIDGFNFCPIRSMAEAVGSFDVTGYKEGTVYVSSK